MGDKRTTAVYVEVAVSNPDAEKRTTAEYAEVAVSHPDAEKRTTAAYTEVAVSHPDAGLRVTAIYLEVAHPLLGVASRGAWAWFWAEGAVTPSPELPFSAGLVGHWGARFLTLNNNDPVSEVTDQGPNAYHLATNTTAYNEPIFKTDAPHGLPELDFSAGNTITERQSLGPPLYSPPIVIQAVCSLPDAQRSLLFVAYSLDDASGLSIGSEIADGDTVPGFLFEVQVGGDYGTKSVPHPLNADRHVITWISDGNAQRLRVDGVEQIVLDEQVPLPAGGSYSAFEVSAGSPISYLGRIAEIVLLEGINEQGIEANEAYLMNLYGIS